MNITIVSTTSRNDSNTLRVASLYQKLFSERLKQDVALLSLQDVNVWERGIELMLLEKHFLIPASHFVFVLPEYNGSFPGIFKTMIDNTDIKSCWWGKKVMLTGIADGRAGNLRGLEHMTGILQYMHMHVYWEKLHLSRISDEIDDQGNFAIPTTAKAVNQQIEGFLNF